MWTYHLVEASAFVLFAAMAFSSRTDKRDAAILWTGSLYGLLVELMFIHFAGGYEYGDFTIVIGGAPLWVAAGWGVILRTSHTTAQLLDIDDWGRPFAAAMMATSLDFALDPIAEDLGWWSWMRPEPGFFGVSYDNFVGWLMIVGSLSLFTMLFQKWWGPFAALPLSVGVVAAATPILEAAYDILGEGLVFFAAHMIFLMAVVTSGWQRVAWQRAIVPIYFHAMFSIIIVAGGVADRHTELYGLIAVATSASVLWFLGYSSRSEMQ